MSTLPSSKAAVGIAALLALGTVPALAQEAAQPAPAAPVAAAPAQAAPAAAPAQAAQAAPSATPADPAAAAATPAAPTETAAVKPPEPPPTLPTTGDGAVITTLLTKVCGPLIAGGKIEQLAKANGMKKDGKTGEFILLLSQKPFQVALQPTGDRNKNVCEMRVRYAPGWDQPIIEAMNIWRFLQDPQLHLQRNDVGQYRDAQRTTTTWDNWENQSFDGKMIGLVLVQLNKPDGGPMTPTYDEAIIQYSIRAPLKLPPQAPVAAQTPPPAPAVPAS